MPGWPASLQPDGETLRTIQQYPPRDARIPSGWHAQWEDVWAPLAAYLAETIKSSDVHLLSEFMAARDQEKAPCLSH